MKEESTEFALEVLSALGLAISAIWYVLSRMRATPIATETAISKEHPTMKVSYWTKRSPPIAMFSSRRSEVLRNRNFISGYRRRHLYEIPITLILNPSREFMRQVATHRHVSHLCCSAYTSQGALMLDLILIALGLAFFAASIAYAYACDRL
jgi:hypothetical protein